MSVGACRPDAPLCDGHIPALGTPILGDAPRPPPELVCGSSLRLESTREVPGCRPSRTDQGCKKLALSENPLPS
eukprot:10659039-Alexandrium_andersonii.AAC.1